MSRIAPIYSTLNRAGLFFFFIALLVYGLLIYGLLACNAMAEPEKAELKGPLGPIDVVASPDQKLLYVVQADAGRIDVVDVASAKVIRRIPSTIHRATPDGPVRAAVKIRSRNCINIAVIEYRTQRAYSAGET